MAVRGAVGEGVWRGALESPVGAPGHCRCPAPEPVSGCFRGQAVLPDSAPRGRIQGTPLSDREGESYGVCQLTQSPLPWIAGPGCYSSCPLCLNASSCAVQQGKKQRIYVGEILCVNDRLSVMPALWMAPKLCSFHQVLASLFSSPQCCGEELQFTFQKSASRRCRRFAIQHFVRRAPAVQKACGIDPQYISNFGEEVIRGQPLFVLSLLLQKLDPMLRKTAELGAWQVR